MVYIKIDDILVAKETKHNIQKQLEEYKMKNNVALITGASSGIGYEMAKIHAGNGCDVIIVARREELLEKLKAEILEKNDVQVKVIVKDLSVHGAAKELYEEIIADGIQVERLINNAGFGGYGKFHERDIEIEKDMVQVDIVALMELTHLFLKDMLKRNSGKIMNVSSTASFLPGPMQSVYFASKAFVTSLTQSIASEIRNSSVTITAFCPGAVATGFVEAGGLEGVGLWDKAASASSAAEFGMEAMEKGKLVAINDKKYEFFVKAVVPLIPRKLLLKEIQKSQTKR